MKRNRLSGLIVIVAALVAFASCSFGLQPSWKKTGGATTFALDLSQSFSGSRALSSGTGYLYIRTVGGPTGDKGPVYGPYTIGSAGIFSTTDIPAGTYEYFCILYAAAPLDALPGFTDLIKLPDADFKTQAMGDTGLLDDIVEGRASGYIESGFTVNQGMINTLNAVLTPMTGSLTLDASATNPVIGLPAAAPAEKRFVALRNLNTAGTAYDTLSCAVSGGTVSLMRLYSASGEYLSLGVPNATDPNLLRTAYPGGNDFYLYVEYTGTPVLTFSLALVGVPTGNVVRIDIDVSSLLSANVAGQRILCGFDTDTGTGPAAVGIGTITPSGIMSLYLKDPLTGLDWIHPGSGTYYLSALIDMSGYYDSVNFPMTAAQLSSIMPLTGDFMTVDKGFAVTIPGTGERAFALTGPNFTQMTEAQIFAANTASGTGDGSSPANAATLVNAINNALALQVSGNVKPPVVYLLSDVALTDSITVDYSVGFGSLGTRRTVTFGQLGALNIAPSGTLESGVYARNVAFDGGTVTGRSAPAFTVGPYGYLQFEDVTVSNFKGNRLLPTAVGAKGGAISATGGHVGLYNTTIQGCAADYGGAIYLAADTPSGEFGSLEMGGSKITGNLANTGAGIYAEANTGINLGAGSEISGNGDASTVQAGGIYCAGNLNAPNMNADGTPYLFLNVATTDPQYYSVNPVDTAVHALFVSQAGGGDGLTETSPTDITTALGNAAIFNILLVSDITVTATLTVPANRTLYVRSNDGNTPFSFLPGPSLNAPVFSVSSYSDLILERVNVGAASGTTSLPTLISVAAEATLNLTGEATLRNNASTGPGGAVFSQGGMVNLLGGTISNCSASQGGAVYAAYDASLASSGNVYLNGGVIDHCTAAVAGGAIYLEGGNLSVYPDTMNSGMPPVTISYCTAPVGGAVYLTQYYDGYDTGPSSFNMNGTPSLASISSCSATAGSGGAIYANGANTTVYLLGGSLNGNTASVSGGAVYAVTGSMVALQPSTPATAPGNGSLTITANQAAAGGGLLMETGVSFMGVTPPDVDSNYVYGNTPSGSDIVGP